MKIRIEEQGYISLKWFGERKRKLNDELALSGNAFEDNTRSFTEINADIKALEYLEQQLHPLKPLAEKCVDRGICMDTWVDDVEKLKQEFLNSEIYIEL